MEQAGGAVIDQQERTKTGTPSMDRPADAIGGLCIGRSRTYARGLGDIGCQQAAPGTYRGIACSDYTEFGITYAFVFHLSHL